MVKLKPTSTGFPKKFPVSCDVEWRVSDALVAYGEAIDWMESRVQEIRANTQPDCIWLLEHPPVYTAGTSADPADLVTPDRFPVFSTGQGGQFQTDAQFLSRRLEVKGLGEVRMKPDPDRQTLIPIREVRLIR